ncbi:hypothetical protein [Ferrimonas kyonanensis]|uniref:hypothetical protein n=1 Tax=Ferrimonas kyonanensis TaxID=364763 RepID=UPI000686C142|nr:hypothetical protein [Ferrimonas kyonanensis]
MKDKTERPPLDNENRLSVVGLFAAIILHTVYAYFIWKVSVSIGGFEPERTVDELGLYMVTGALGGMLYCLRAIYHQWCVVSSWSNRWLVWHALRPICSALMGGVAFLMIKSGMQLFNFEQTGEQVQWANLLLALVAGYNVSQMQKWMEGQFRKSVGVEPTNQANNSKHNI